MLPLPTWTHRSTRLVLFTQCHIDCMKKSVYGPQLCRSPIATIHSFDLTPPMHDTHEHLSRNRLQILDGRWQASVNTVLPLHTSKFSLPRDQWNMCRHLSHTTKIYRTFAGEWKFGLQSYSWIKNCTGFPPVLVQIFCSVCFCQATPHTLS